MSSKPNGGQPRQRNAPSFVGCQPASALASRIKRRNRKVGTKGEMALRRALWRLGLRYRVNQGDVPGSPDLVFRRHQVAVFVDGDFWHGRDWERRKGRLASGNNGTYWLAKIAYNRDRDRRNDSLLAALGWRVVRLWETDVLKNPESAANQVAGIVAAHGRKMA